MFIYVNCSQEEVIRNVIWRDQCPWIWSS